MQNSFVCDVAVKGSHVARTQTWITVLGVTWNAAMV